MRILITSLLAFACFSASAGIINPDCTAEKAAKSAAMNATTGISGRCSAKEAAADTVNLDAKKDKIADAKDKVSDASNHSGVKAVRNTVR
ncbi:hypothetical protein [Rahnella woolbedingensis]|uniref:Uncharacterized protein n=1 Tax=Rahnella woolbedingensis TaxID=1510574 RepID=A0A419NDA3_9GAMM|nr:hypothetical protein [Rahnella woolbedingensis]RJT46414.1 hypothetical protein D6C13_04120 [Rahnella woolbedingensis]